MRRYGAFVVARLCVVGFFLMTSAYAILNCSPFAFDMFVRPMLLPWLGQFVQWHHLGFCAAYVASICTFPPGLRSPAAVRTGSQKVARWLAVGFVAVFGMASIALVLSPLLPTLWKDGRALPIAVAALLPLLTLASIDLLAWPLATGDVRLRPVTGERRLLIACSAAAGYLWFVHLLRAISQGDGTGGPLIWLLTSIRALSLAAVFFALVYMAAVLIVAVAARARTPQGVELGCSTVALAVGIGEFLRRAVLPTLSITGTTAAILAITLGVTGAATWAGIVLRRPTAASAERWTGLDLLFSPQWGRAAVVAGLAVVPAVAFGALRSIEQIDWSFVGRRSILFAEGVLILGLMLRLSGKVPARAVPPRRVLVAPLAVLVMFLAWPVFAARLAAWSGDHTLQPEAAFERHAMSEAGFKVLADLLVERPGTGADYYAFLHEHANLTGAVRVSVPDIDLVAPTVPVSRAREPKPDIFVFAIDSLRRDYVAPYNPAVTFTPNIAAFAAEGFAFQNAFTRHGGTELALTSIWAGAAVVRQVRGRDFPRMNALEKLVNSDGYRILINDFTIAAHLQPSTPVTTIDEGVASVDTDLCSNLAALERELDKPTGHQPVFAYFAPMNVHILNTRRAGQHSSDGDYPGFYAPYAARLQRLDGCFGRFTSYLRQRGRYDDSIIVLTSDHGDSLGENGFWGHAMYLFPEDVRIPFIVHIPERLKPYVTTDLARLTFSSDLAPTLYALLGHRLNIPAAHFGEPLFVPAGATLSDRRRRSFLLTSSYGPTYALLRRNGRFLYVSDLLQRQEFAYDQLHGPIGEAVTVEPELRWLNQRQIREQVGALGAFYGFAR